MEDDLYKRIYKSLIDTDSEKRVKIFLRTEDMTLYGNGEVLLQEVDRANPNIIDMEIYGKSEQEQAFNIVPTLDEPIPIVSLMMNNKNLRKIETYRDYLYSQESKNNVEQNIYYGDLSSDRKWETFEEENDFYVFRLSDTINSSYLDYSLDFSLDIDEYNANIPLEDSPIICSHFENINDTSKEGIWVDENRNLYIRIKKDRISRFDVDVLNGYLSHVGTIELAYVLKYQKNTNPIINMPNGSNISVLFDCDLIVENEDVMVNRENKDFTKITEVVSNDYFSLPYQL